MKDFNLQKYLRDNPLTEKKQVLKNGKINEAFEGFGGVRSIAPVNEAPIQTRNSNFDPTDTADYDEQSRPNKWIADIDRLKPTYGDWTATYEYPGIIVWSHPDVPNAMVVATPGWDGKGTPVEFQSAAGSSQMLKILDQDDFPTVAAYIKAIAPYLDMVEDANVNPDSTDYEKSDIKAPGMEEEGYMGTQYDSSEDMAVDMVKKGVRENDYFDRRRASDDMRTMSSSNERLEGLVNQRELAKFGEAVMAMAQDLMDDGFDADDVKRFLVGKLNNMIVD